MNEEHDHTFDEHSNIDGDPMRPTILLYPSGVYFEPYAPNPKHLDIRCLAHGLAGMNRSCTTPPRASQDSATSRAL